MRPDLTQAQVRELFDYRDGNLFWRVKPGKNIRVGTLAGHERKEDGYRVIKYAGSNRYVHRLIWIWHFGEAPPEVDHRDTNPRNNLIGNLRAATHSENQHNSGKRADNTSGYKGVTRNKGTGKFSAEIKHQGRRTYLGCFTDPAAAHAAYLEAAKRLHGEFARTSI